MAKKKVIIGSVVKSKDFDKTKETYIKIRGEHTLKDGQTLSVQSPKEQLASAENAMKEGKLSEDLFEKIKARLEKVPDFVLKEIFYLSDK